MLEIVVRTENWERHVRVSAEELAGLVRRIGGDGDLFLVVQRIPDLPDVFAQVWHKTGGDYTLEYRDGAADRHFQAMANGPEVVIAAMTGWARQEAGWDSGLAWSLLDMGPAREVPPLDLGKGERPFRCCGSPPTPPVGPRSSASTARWTRAGAPACSAPWTGHWTFIRSGRPSASPTWRPAR